MKQHVPARIWIIAGFAAAAVLALVIFWTADKKPVVHESAGLYFYQDGVKVLKGIACQTPDDPQETLSIPFKLDGNDVTLTYTVVRRDGRIIPLHKSGPGALDALIYPLIRIGSTNRFVIQNWISLYIVDFDKMEIAKFLPDESDGVSMDDVVRLCMENEEGYYYWAAEPCISPDGQFLMYMAYRADDQQNLRLYDFSSGKDRLLASGRAYSGLAVWNGQKSVIVEEMNNLVEIDLSGTDQVTPVSDLPVGQSWCGIYPDLLFMTGKNGLTWINPVTRKSKTIELLEEKPAGVILKASADPAHPCAAVWHGTADGARLDLFRFDTKKVIRLMEFDKPFELQAIQWFGPGRLLLCGTLDGIMKTYEIFTS